MARPPVKVDCLFPECPYEDKRRVRGLCINHYQACLRLVTLGQTTWAALEERGAALPARPHAKRNPDGRKFVTWALGEGQPTATEGKDRSKKAKRGSS